MEKQARDGDIGRDHERGREPEGRAEGDRHGIGIRVYLEKHIEENFRCSLKNSFLDLLVTAISTVFIFANYIRSDTQNINS